MQNLQDDKGPYIIPSIKFTGDERMLQVEAVAKTFDDLIALDKVDLSLKQGHSLALIGPVTGKSVLFKCLVGLYAPSEGLLELTVKRLVQRTKTESTWSSYRHVVSTKCPF